MGEGLSARSKTRQLAVLAYGSLLAHPGSWLGRRMEKLIRCTTPFGVEYVGQASTRRGGAPTLVRWAEAQAVKGALIVLPYIEEPDQLAVVRKELAHREGVAETSSSIKDDRDMLGFRVVYSDFSPKFAVPNVEELAQAAISSVAKCSKQGRPFMNGIRYLLDNLEWGVNTHMTADYRQAILRFTDSCSLEEAEYKELSKARRGSFFRSCWHFGWFHNRRSARRGRNARTSEPDNS